MIKLDLDGFEQLIKAAEKAGKDADKVCEKVVKQGAEILDSELKSQLKAVGADADLISGMDAPEYEHTANTFKASAGFHKGSYNPHNLSIGYKALFFNYGTPRRKRHGKEAARGYIQKAKSKSKSKIKKLQKSAYDEIMEGLKK